MCTNSGPVNYLPHSGVTDTHLEHEGVHFFSYLLIGKRVAILWRLQQQVKEVHVPPAA